MSINLRAAGLALIPLALAFGVLTAACGDDDEGGGVAVIDASGSVVPGPSPEPDPDPEADPEAQPQAGVVGDKPDGATQVDIILSEWGIAAPATATAGKIYFLVQNAGPEDAHEFVVIRTDLAPDALPVEDGRIPEDEVDLLDEIEPFTPGSSASLVLDLEPGSYVLICNIAEVEEGELESHYQMGMHTAFTVE
ncbi:MAG: hypothetical protein WEC75_01995 [Dehalococcoidia bacterium]